MTTSRLPRNEAPAERRIGGQDRSERACSPINRSIEGSAEDPHPEALTTSVKRPSQSTHDSLKRQKIEMDAAQPLDTPADGSQFHNGPAVVSQLLDALANASLSYYIPAEAALTHDTPLHVAHPDEAQDDAVQSPQTQHTVAHSDELHSNAVQSTEI